jgi:hypothetical protein
MDLLVPEKGAGTNVAQFVGQNPLCSRLCADLCIPLQLKSPNTIAGEAYFPSCSRSVRSSLRLRDRKLASAGNRTYIHTASVHAASDASIQKLCSARYRYMFTSTALIASMAAPRPGARVRRRLAGDATTIGDGQGAYAKLCKIAQEAMSVCVAATPFRESTSEVRAASTASAT